MSAIRILNFAADCKCFYKLSQKSLLSQSLCWFLVSSPRNTIVFLRVEIRPAAILNQNPFFEMAYSRAGNIFISQDGSFLSFSKAAKFSKGLKEEDDAS